MEIQIINADKILKEIEKCVQNDTEVVITYYDYNTYYFGHTFKKETTSCTLSEVNYFRNIVTSDGGNVPFFGDGFAISSIATAGDNRVVYSNSHIDEELIKVEKPDNYSDKLRELMFGYSDLDTVIEKINEYREQLKQQETPDESLFSDLFTENEYFGLKGPVYAFTNEALSLYMGNYGFTGKTVLASMGSGDFALNSYLLGAASVDGFDINAYTKYFYDFKKAIIKTYSYDEFMELIKNPLQLFDKFEEYGQNLPAETRQFVQDVFIKYGGYIKAFASKFFIDNIGIPVTQFNVSNTFSNFRMFADISQFKNLYLRNEVAYNELRQKIINGIDQDEEFYLGDIRNHNSTKKYDIIYLSNIGDYLSKEEVERLIAHFRENMLTENGIIISTSITNDSKYDGTEDASRGILNDTSIIENYNATHKEKIPYELFNHSIYTIPATQTRRNNL